MKLKSLMLTLFLIVALLVIVIDYIYLQHKTRNQFVKLQTLIKEERNLNADWGRLQIEHSTLVNNSRIEKEAKNQLGMKLPESEQILSIKR
jgi:cell division protein FtsL